MLADLGWVDLDLDSSPSWWATTSYLLPKQDGGTSQIQVNPTQLSQQMDLPVEGILSLSKL